MKDKLKEAKEVLKKEEYKLRWSGHVHPYNHVRSAQFTVTQYWRDKVKKLESEMENKLRLHFQSINSNIQKDIIDLPNILDFNTLSLEQMADYLRNKYAYSSSGDAKCIYHLLEFYDKNK